MVNKVNIGKTLVVIVSILLIIPFIGCTASAASNETRSQLPDGPIHSNELTKSVTSNSQDIASNTISSTALSTSTVLSTSTSNKILIVTSGHGPLTGISPIDEKDYWVSIIQNMGLGTPDWYDGSPSISLLNQYDLVVYDAGGYWYPLSYEVDALWEYHFSGKPLIVVAPDLNYDWSSIKTTTKPTFPEDVLHIEGVLGILPEASFEVIANTGHEIVKSIPTNQHIPVASQSSWPDAFDPRPDGQEVLTQGYISATEFGVGTSSGLPSGSSYDPKGTLYSVVAYPGSANEGRTITFGFPPTALQDSAILDTLAKSTISWALGTKKVPITLYIEDAPSDVKVNKAPGDIIDIVEQIENQEQSSEDVDVRLEIPSDLFGNPTTVFVRDSFTDTNEAGTVAWTEPTNGVYSTSINLASNSEKQIVWRFRIPETASAQDDFKLTGRTLVNNLIASSDDSLIKIVSSTETLIITNREALFDKFGDTQSNKEDVHSLLSYLYEISDANSIGEKSGVVFYADRYDSTIANWNQNVDYTNENTANTVANAIDTIIGTKYDKLSPCTTKIFGVCLSKSHPSYLMIIGGDEIIPFYRANDANFVNGESGSYTSNDPVLNMFKHNYFPTDNVYSDMDDDWNMGNPELSTGRISAASADDMRQLILNGITGPSNINTAVVASRNGYDTKDKIVSKLNEKNINVLNDIENPVTVENETWTKNDLTTIMKNGFKIFVHGGHADYDWLDSGINTNDIIIVDMNDAINNNRPLVAVGGCHGGLTTAVDSSYNAYDNIAWAFIHHGASGFLGSGSLVYGSVGEYDWADLFLPYGERLFNDYFDYLITGDEATRPVGEALKLAERKYNPGLSIEGEDRKAVVQFILYGVPWMTFDPPISSTQTAIDDFTIVTSSPQVISSNTYKKNVEIDINSYDISQIEGFDLLHVSGASTVPNDFKPILPTINVQLNLPSNSNIIDIQLVPSSSTYLGPLNVPSFKSSTMNDPPTSSLTDVTDVTGLFPEIRYVTRVVNSNDHNEVNIGVSPFQFNTLTKDTTFFNKTVLEITYETSNPVVITDLTTDKPAYNSGETVDTSTSIENVGAETIAGMYLELTLKDMVGQVLASTSSSSFDLPVGSSEINTALSTNELPQGSYVLEVTAFDNTNTPRASTSTFIYIAAGRISNFVITPDQAIQGDDMTFEFTFENFASTNVVANGAVHIYNKAGVEVANLPTAPLTVNANSLKTISVIWNTMGKDVGDYTALATIATDSSVFGPLFGSFSISPLDTNPPSEPITVEAGPEQTVEEGTTVNFDGNFTASGSHTYSYHWNFGDGSEEDSSLTTSHIYADDGAYTVNLTVTDEEGNFGNDTLLVTVNNAIPVVYSGSDLEVTAGDPVSFTGNFSDPGWLDTHTAEWNFGEGTLEAGSVSEENEYPNSTGTVSGNFSYFDTGKYTVTLNVADNDGGIGQDQLTVTVRPIKAEVTFDPETFNLNSTGEWVTAYIELPAGYSVSGIDLGSVLLNGTVHAVSDPKYDFVTNESEYMKDLDLDGIPERMFKFNRAEVAGILKAGDKVTVTFTGKVEYNNGIFSGMASFEGSDVIKVTESKNKK